MFLMSGKTSFTAFWNAERMIGPEQAWEVRSLQKQVADPRLVRAVGAVLPGGAASVKSAAYWQWKHIDNPAGASTGAFAEALASGQVIGVRPFMRWRLESASGATLDVVRAVDTVTDPGWQGRGVFKQLSRTALDSLNDERCPFIFNTPNANSAPGYRKLGWQRIGRMPMYIRPRRPMRLAHALAIRGRAFGRGQKPDVESFGLQHEPAWRSAVECPGVRKVIKDHGVSRVRRGLRTERSFSFLEWRYARHPHVDYRVVVWPETDSPRAVAVVRPNIRFGLNELVIADLWAIGADSAAMAQCLRRILRETSADYLVAHFARGSPEWHALRRNFFLRPYRQGMDLYVRKLVGMPEDPDPMDLRSWDLCLGDLELF